MSLAPSKPLPCCLPRSSRAGNAMRMRISARCERFWQFALMRMRCKCEFQSASHSHFNSHFYILLFHEVWNLFFLPFSEYQNGFKPFFILIFSIVVMFPVVFLFFSKQSRQNDAFGVPNHRKKSKMRMRINVQMQCECELPATYLCECDVNANSNSPYQPYRERVLHPR